MTCRDVIGNNPTYTCTIAHVSYRYDYFSGEENNYVQQQQSSFYFKQDDTNKWAVTAGHGRSLMGRC